MTYHKTMKYYKEDEQKKRVICSLCRHPCKLKEGQVGICGVNKNVNGELKTLVYGHPIAVNVDPVEKKPLYHMLPWHLSAFSPNYKMLDHKATRLETLERAKKIGKEAGLEYIYLGNVMVSGDTHYPHCDELLIDRNGYRVTVNTLENGHCPKCDKAIEGVWQ